ncbi:FG-GAP-like repeat-containing protein [Streptomyces sp. NPDC005438]|uniref:FG-GAP-like repeat-containing protein n=1 Tax=Streptomyces sp. NPDC005438 TaxID=3156880 RepID=UPI0033A97034
MRGSGMRGRILAIAVATTAVTGIALAGTTSFASPGKNDKPAAKADSKPADLDGDGFNDLATGAPEATVKGFSKAGYVAVTFGSEKGISTKRHQAIDQSSPGVPGTPEAGDRFGSAVATGDLNGDGYADLVISAEGEAIGDVKKAGSVTIVFGSAKGLTDKAIAFHSPNPSTYQEFGKQLAVGDFDNDGIQDLATTERTKVVVVKGSKNLSSTPTPKLKYLDPTGGGVDLNAIAAGDVNGDGFTDLVTTASQDDPADEGTLAVIGGSKSGLSKQLGKSTGLPFAGYDPVVGDINGDGKDDVLVDTGFSDGPDGWKLRTFPGSADGLDVDGAVEWKGKEQAGEARELADVNGDGFADLVVSDTSAVDSDGYQNAGALHVLRGSKDWLTETGAQTVSLDTEGVAGVAEGSDQFGSSLSPADYNGDGITDLMVGAAGKWIGSGAVSTLYGSDSGLTGKGSIIYGPDSLDLPYTKARFGHSLSTPPAG